MKGNSEMEPNEQTPQATPTETVNNQDDSSPLSLEARLQAMQAEIATLKAHNSELNHEAASRRIKAKEAEARAAEQEQLRMAEQGQYKELFERTRAELDSAKAAQEQLEQVQERIKARNAKRIAEIPEQWRDVVPVGYTPLELETWLDANATKLTLPKAPNLDAGARGAGKPSVQLTPMELEAARKLQFTPEQYAAFKQGS